MSWFGFSSAQILLAIIVSTLLGTAIGGSCGELDCVEEGGFCSDLDTCGCLANYWGDGVLSCTLCPEYSTSEALSESKTDCICITGYSEDDSGNCVPDQTASSTPANTSHVPATTTGTPAKTSAVPATTTAVPANTTAVPANTTAVPANTTATTIPATTIPATTIPATTIPATTIPATTIPATTIPATTIPTATPPTTPALEPTADPCASSNCDENASCQSTGETSFDCHCNVGFEGDGVDCQPLIACVPECSDSASCILQDDKPVCECNDGFSGSGLVCMPNLSNSTEPPTTPPTDSSTASPTTPSVSTTNPPGDPCSICSDHASCWDDGSSILCECNSGYTGDGFTCTVITNHCDDGTHHCDAAATCTSLADGSYLCDCNKGYSGTGYACSLDVVCSEYSSCAACVDQGCAYCSGACHPAEFADTSCVTETFGSCYEEELPTTNEATGLSSSTPLVMIGLVCSVLLFFTMHRMYSDKGFRPNRRNDAREHELMAMETSSSSQYKPVGTVDQWNDEDWSDEEGGWESYGGSGSRRAF